jgi:3-oxoadipate enol-lactonase
MNPHAVRLNFKESGQGVPIILLHGFPFNNSIWDKVVPHLAGYARLICPDLRGHGKSPAPDGIYSMESMASDIALLMDTLSIEKAILVGHSMGGYISLAFIAEFQQRCIGLGLVASGANADLPEKRKSRYQIIADLEVNGTDTILANMPDSLTNSPEVKHKVIEMIQMTPIPGLVGALKGMAERPDRMNLLPAISVPTLIVAGDNDKIIPIEAATRMAQKIPDCKLEIIPGAAHMPMLEKPLALSRVLTDLIERVKADRGYSKGVT